MRTFIITCRNLNEFYLYYIVITILMSKLNIDRGIRGAMYYPYGICQNSKTFSNVVKYWI
jgi:hypothetical protein